MSRTGLDGFDYVEGFVFVNSSDPVNGWPSVPFPSGPIFDPGRIPIGSGPVLYCLEVAVHLKSERSDKVDEVRIIGGVVAMGTLVILVIFFS